MVDIEIVISLYFRSAGCPVGFTYIQPVNGCYKVANRKLSWADAGLECRSIHRDAHLLVISDAQEQTAIAGMISRQFPFLLSSLSSCALSDCLFVVAYLAHKG